MRQLVWLFLLLFAGSVDAQNDPDDLLPRLGSRYSCALEYTRYQSGRSRLVVAGVDEGGFGGHGEVVLIRLPDSRRGRGVVIDRISTEPGVMELSFVRLIDHHDIAALLHVKHADDGITLSVHGGKLTESAPVAANEANTLDLDHDGTPEIVSYCCWTEACGGTIYVSLYWWSGSEYKKDRKTYAAMVDSRVNQDSTRFKVEDIPGPRRRYVVYVYGSPTKVLIDDRPVMPGQVFDLSADCHTLRLFHTKKFAAAFVEQRTVRK